MSINWTGKQTTDADSLATVLQAKVNGQSVSVYISQEALQDLGLNACMSKAEEKINATIASGTTPTRVDVRTTDF